MTSKVNLATPAYNSSNWNTPLNTNFDSLNTALGSAYSTAITSADVTLNSIQAQNSLVRVWIDVFHNSIGALGFEDKLHCKVV